METTFRINETTKISELIKANKASIEAIAGVAKPFHRLRNPILRKVMASRVTIAEAANMGGCTVERIVEVLAPLGFTYEPLNAETEAVQEKPAWLRNARPEDVTWLDVRPVIESGTDPLKEILAAIKPVPAGSILCVINTFVPTPLIHLLRQEMVSDSYVEHIATKEVHTYFLRREKPAKEKSATTGDEKVHMHNAVSFGNILSRFSAAQIVETDVREMEMPMPMQTILKELSVLPDGHILYVHHKRVPVYLLEELADKQYEIHMHVIDDSTVEMILFKS